jgi:arylsulfatase A-like enzyme
MLLIAACFGLLCGLAEAINAWAFSLIPDNRGWKNDTIPEILWIAPILNLLLFLTLGLVLVPLGRLFSKLRSDLLAYATFGWLAGYGALAVSGRLHQITCIILGLALAVLLCRHSRSRREVSNILLMRILGFLVVSVVLIVLTGIYSERTAESSEPRTLPRSTDAPNVLLITLDTLRADHLSSFGYSRQTTPNLDRLAQEGVLFEDAFATASWTLPSHASIMTGRYPHEHRAGAVPLDGRFPTLAEQLYSLGYATAGFVSNVYYCTARTGLARGFSTYEDNFGTVLECVRETFYGKMLLDRLPLLGYYDLPGRKRAADVNREFLSWLDANRRARFFAFLNYLDVHDPYIAPDPYNTAFTSNPGQGDVVNSLLYPRHFTGPRPLTDQQRQAEIDGYDGSLIYLDHELGSLFDRLRAMGVLDKTLIIVTSDHGESFGNHGLYGHGNGMYVNLLHVPLIVRYPGGIPAGLRVSEAVSLRAIPATVMNVLGLDSQSPFPGPPLSQYWTGTSTQDSNRAFSEALKGIVQDPAYPLGRRSIVKSISTSESHLIVYEDGRVELFRLDRDPMETNNLADSPESQDVIEELGSGLEKLMSPSDWKIFRYLLNHDDPKSK